MGLKGFHIVFIVFATILTFGFCAWTFWEYLKNLSFAYLATSVLSLIFALGLIMFEISFLKRVKA